MPTLVVHVVHYLVVGGLENGIVNLVNAPRPGQRHAVICMTIGGANRARIDSAVPVFELHKSTGHDVRTFARLVRRLRRLRPDVVHTRNWATFDGVLAARLARVPMVVHGEHGRDASDPDGQNRRRNRLRRLLSPLIDRFVAVSDDLRRWLMTDVGIRGDKVLRIHNGVDTERYAPGDPLKARDALGVQPQRLVIGTVGRLNPVKDQAALIRAFATLQRRAPESLLVIAGDGPCRQDLEALVASLQLTDRVLFLGERHDVPDILRAFDIFVLPSIAEGISNTVLEAMATGLPVVATRVGGTPELVVDGITGHLVAPHSPEGLAAAIGKYLTDPATRSAHGHRARERAVKEFALDTMRDGYAELYKGLCGDPKAASVRTARHPIDRRLEQGKY